MISHAHIMVKVTFFCIISLMTSLMLTLPAARGADLTILHMNDHHSHLTADSRLDLVLDGQKTRVRSGGFPALVAKFEFLEWKNKNTLKLHAGDAITGDLYYTLFKGEADAAMMNEVCFDAFALGNHEFDDGDAGLTTFLDHLADSDCNTAVLAANVIPELGVSPLAKTSATDYIQPYLITTIGGEKVGIIGIDIATKTKQSSSPDESTRFLDETKTAQKYINILQQQGIERIILLTHYQYRNDIALAKALRGVDVIIGGDSHSLLGDFNTLGLSSEGPYPTIVTGADGQRVCIAHAWQYSQIAGELHLNFMPDGSIKNCSGTPHMVLADSFKRRNEEGERVEVEGTDRTAILNDIAAHPNIAIIIEDASAANHLSSFSKQVKSLKEQIIGTATDKLCLERIPGQGKSQLCSPAETQERGADISNLVARAFRDMSRTGEIAIQNGGGVRTDVPQGPFSIGDAYQLLPFANTLVALEMTGAEIKAVLEEALDYALNPEGSTGAFPYAAGLRWNILASNPKGARFITIEYKGPQDTSWQPLSETKRYQVITNDYIAGGRDGYLTFKTVAQSGRLVNTYLDYAQSFVDYVSQRGEFGKLPVQEYSTQSYAK